METISPPGRAVHNLGRASTRRSRWCGMDVLHIRQEVLPGCAWQDLGGERPVLSMVVSEEGGRCEARLDRTVPTRPWGHVDASGHCSLIPADLSVWGYSDQIAAIEEVRVFLDPDALAAAFDDDVAAALLKAPRLMIFDRDLQRLARLMAARLEEPADAASWGETVLLAALSRLAGVGQRPRRGGLSARQVRDVTQYVRDNLAEPLRVDDLAAVAGLSASQFARSFKASIGTAPHGWLLNMRLEQAKAMLSERDSELAEIALATGFSEQSHFTRAFAAATGLPPGRWRRAQTA